MLNIQFLSSVAADSRISRQLTSKSNSDYFLPELLVDQISSLVLIICHWRDLVANSQTRGCAATFLLWLLWSQQEATRLFISPYIIVVHFTSLNI